MIKKMAATISCAIFCLLVTGCLYRGDGVFKKIGDSDFKLRLNFLNMFAVADGRPTYVGGAVFLEDHITPLKNTRITLKITDTGPVISSSYTDHVGIFNMSGILSHVSYTVEIDSAEYVGSKVIMVERNNQNWYQIIAHKK